MKHHRTTVQLALIAGLCAAWCHAALADTESGLAASYPFNRNARDASGHRNHGVAAGAFLTEDRFFNPRQAYAFTGDNSRIRAANSPSLNVGAAGMTLSAWVFPTQFTGPGERRTIVRKMEPTGGSGGYLLALDPNGRPQFGFRPDGVSYYEVRGAVPVPTNQWSHLVLSYDGSLAKFFINGAETSAVNQSGAVGPSTTALTIGQRGWTNNTDNFFGAIDEVRIYDRALPNPDVTELFRTQNNQPPEVRIVVLPRSAFPGFTNHILISPQGEPVRVTLNGARSEDPEGQLAYSWQYHGNEFGTGAVANVWLPPGTHPIVLEVTDGVVMVQDGVTIDVITLQESIGVLMEMVENSGLPPMRKRNLMATLNQVAQSSNNNRLNARLHYQLFAFQNKVQAQLGRTHPRLAAELIQGARAVAAAARAR